MKILFFLLCIALTVAARSADSFPDKVAGKTVRLLTIGNSFSANATRNLADIAKAGGNALIHRPVVVGGSSFQVHADKAQAYEKDPKDTAGLYTNGRSLRELLLSDQWDVVTIQQASRQSHDYASYQPYAGWLRDYVHLHAPQAELLVHETWEYRRDDPRFTKKPAKPGEPVTQQAMYDQLNAAYQRIATELGVERIPVGDAFHLADTDPAWGYQVDTTFDPKKAKPLELPNQRHSLHMGWQWKKVGEKLTLGLDGHHANAYGEYLGGCVWYEVLFGESVVGNTFAPKGISPEDVRYLQETAHRAVARLAKK